VTTNEEVWQHDRRYGRPTLAPALVQEAYQTLRILNPAFNKRFLREFLFPIVVNHASTMVSLLESIGEYNKVPSSRKFGRVMAS